MTNADRIRKMTDEELLGQIMTLIKNAFGFHVPSDFCKIDFNIDREINRQWLESEYIEECRW